MNTLEHNLANLLEVLESERLPCTKQELADYLWITLRSLNRLLRERGYRNSSGELSVAQDLVHLGHFTLGKAYPSALMVSWMIITVSIGLLFFKRFFRVFFLAIGILVIKVSK